MNNQICSIKTLTGNNLKKWKSDIELALELADLDIALPEDEPPKPNDKSTIEERAYYQRWGGANRLSIQIMKKYT